MTEKLKKRGAAHLISAILAGIVFAAAISALFTALILFVTDFLLFTRPPSVGFVTWTGRILERIHGTFVLILWGLTFLAALVSLFKEPFENWGRSKLDAKSELRKEKLSTDEHV